MLTFCDVPFVAISGEGCGLSVIHPWSQLGVTGWGGGGGMWCTLCGDLNWVCACALGGWGGCLWCIFCGNLTWVSVLGYDGYGFFLWSTMAEIFIGCFCCCLIVFLFLFVCLFLGRLCRIFECDMDLMGLDLNVLDSRSRYKKCSKFYHIQKSGRVSSPGSTI